MTGSTRNKTMVITKYPNDFIFKLRSYKCNAGKLPKLPLVTTYARFKETLWFTFRRELSENAVNIVAVEIHDYIMENDYVFEFKSKEAITKEALEQLNLCNVHAYYCDLSEKHMKEVYNLIHYVRAHTPAQMIEQIVETHGLEVEKITEEASTGTTETGKIKMGRRLKTKESKDEVSKEATKEVKSDEQGETKHEKFMRLSLKDIGEIKHRLDMMGKRANLSVYDFTEEDIDELFFQIQDELDFTKRLYLSKLRNKRGRKS